MAAPEPSSNLEKLRKLMEAGGPISAYIIPSGDAHMSEFVAASEKRREFITGFTGSTGTAVVTMTDAALWTDGRYYIRAAAEMDYHWKVMKDGLPDTPTIGEWLCQTLPKESLIAGNPFLLSSATWIELQTQLTRGGHTLIPIKDDLIDQIWENQPERPLNPVIVLPIKYSGLLNLRGSDVDFNPLFYSYLVITESCLRLFIDERKVTDDLKIHLDVSQGQVSLHPYDQIQDELMIQVSQTKNKIWLSEKWANYALYQLLPKNRLISSLTPVALMKSVKNSTEIQGMKNAHIRDAVALCEYLYWLEKQNIAKEEISEISGARKLGDLRKQQDDFMGLCKTISASASDGAIIHYQATEATNKAITDQDLYLVDSGGQYRDGTTDVTRTIHLGNPTDYEKECFTRVLQGHIKLATTVFPNGVTGHRIDCIARSKLWEVGLDFLHGTGHGVGSFLCGHEGPCAMSYKTSPSEVALAAGMILSNEPGYYEDGNFGLRIENLVLVVKADTKIQWLNSYHDKVRTLVGPALQAQNKAEVYDWLLRETTAIHK